MKLSKIIGNFLNKIISMHVRFLISHISLVKLRSQIIHDPSIKQFIQLSSTLIAGKDTLHISICKNKCSIVLTLIAGKDTLHISICKDKCSIVLTLIAGKDTLHISICKNKCSIVLTVGFRKNPD